SGKDVRLTDESKVRATNSDGSSPVVGPTTLTFTSAPAYAGPATLTFEVTDGESAGPRGPHGGAHPRHHRRVHREHPADLRRSGPRGRPRRTTAGAQPASALPGPGRRRLEPAAFRARPRARRHRRRPRRSQPHRLGPGGHPAW